MDMMDIVERYELGDEAKMMAKISLVIEACQRFYAIGGSTLGDIGFDAKLASVMYHHHRYCSSGNDDRGIWRL